MKYINDVIKTSYLEEKKDGDILEDSEEDDLIMPPIEARETGISNISIIAS